MAATLLLSALGSAQAAGLFDAPLFSSGMILQRGAPSGLTPPLPPAASPATHPRPCAPGAGTKLWGANATGPVTVTVSTGAKATSAAPTEGGAWSVSLPNVDVAMTSTVTASDGKTTDTLTDVAWGEVLLCGGQSNM